MSIRTYFIKGQSFYEVYTSHSSIKHRAQRRKKNIKTKGEAKTFERLLKKECIEEVQIKDGLGDKWSDIVGKYKVFKSSYGNVQEDTIEDYVSMLRIWTNNIWNKPICEITRSDIREAIEYAKSSGKSNSYLTKILHTTGRVFRWAKEEGLCPNTIPNITAGLKVSRIEDRAPKILSLVQLQYFLQQARESNNPWFPIWSTAIHTGMRSGELFALKWSSVDLDKRTILVDESFNKRKNIFKSTKSGQFRSVPVNDFLFSVLVDLRNTSTSEYVLPRLSKWVIGHQAKEVQVFCSQIGLPLVNFHTFRACFATHLLSQGVPLGQVMKCGGWAELKTVQRYNRLAGVNEKGATDCLNSLGVTIDPNLLKFGSHD